MAVKVHGANYAWPNMHGHVQVHVHVNVHDNAQLSIDAHFICNVMNATCAAHAVCSLLSMLSML